MHTSGKTFPKRLAAWKLYGKLFLFASILTQQGFENQLAVLFYTSTIFGVTLV